MSMKAPQGLGDFFVIIILIVVAGFFVSLL